MDDEQTVGGIISLYGVQQPHDRQGGAGSATLARPMLALRSRLA